MHMQFSEHPEDNYFFSQPHQPFFLLAFINALITMIIFALAYQQIINIQISASNFHAYGFIHLLFTPAFFAFLFTTFPKLASTESIERKRYMPVFNLYYLGSTLFLLGSISSPLLSALGMILLFIGNVMGLLILKNIYTRTEVADKQHLYWILVAMSFGMLSHLLFIIGQLWSQSLVGFSTEIATYLYLFFLAFNIAMHMVPFFSHIIIEKNITLPKNIFFLLLAHIFIEGIYTNASFFIDFIITIVLFREIYRWKMNFPNPNPLLWILHIALYWSVFAFALGGIANLISLVSDVYFLALDIHSILLGFVFTILIGFGTRVTLGHSGNLMQADTYILFLFYWTQVVVLSRVITSFMAAFGLDFMLMFDISAIVWILMFIAWGLRFFIVLIKGKKLS